MSKQIIKTVRDTLDTNLGQNTYRLICLAVTGSNAYGIQTAESDLDFMGLFLPNEDYILGLKNIEQVEINQGIGKDIQGVMYDLRKWYSLMIKQNPNVLELLWHTENMYMFRDTLIWPLIIKEKENLLSKKLKHSFSGYAHAQIIRIQKLNQKVNQNPKRLESFKKWGYDVKAASTCIRLLNTGLDALVEHELTVLRPERHQLISIREGRYTYDELVKLANEKQALLDQAYITSTLRNKVDFEWANQFLIKILKTHLQLCQD